jgi:histidine kinase
MDRLLEKVLKEDFLDIIPFQVALLDKNYNIVWANNQFKKFYGDNNTSKTCYKICKKNSFPCNYCKVPEVARTGEPMVAYETLTDAIGRKYNYSVYFMPIKDEYGETEYILEISTEQKDAGWQREYNILFDLVPCFITIIDREFNIIRSNDKFRETFGDSRNKTCYQAYKKRRTECPSCPAVMSFEDGQTHTSTQIGLSANGDKTYYLVTTAPIAQDEKGVSLVMELSLDITEINNLQEQLRNAHDFYSAIIQNSSEGIIALDNKGKLQIINNSARRILNWRESKKPSVNLINKILPQEFFRETNGNEMLMKPREIEILNIDDARVPVRFWAIEVRDKKNVSARVAFMQDLRPLKELEYEKDLSMQDTKDSVFNYLDRALDILQDVIANDFNRLEEKMAQKDENGINECIALLKFKLEHTRKVKNAFIAFSKRHKVIKEKIDLNSILDEVYKDFYDAAVLHHLDFYIEKPKENISIECNRQGIRACIDIMLLNSLNALAKVDNNGYLKLKAYKDLGVVILEVQHNACRKGIAPPASVIKEDCFGINTAESILRENHGVIDIVSRNGVCTFKIKLPN